jgi:hypothetical protein
MIKTGALEAKLSRKELIEFNNVNMGDKAKDSAKSNSSGLKCAG